MKHITVLIISTLKNGGIGPGQNLAHLLNDTGSVVMVFVIVMVSGQQTPKYCEVVAIFRRHILRDNIG